MKTDRWLTVQEATELVNSSRPEGVRPISVRQVRRRLYHLHSDWCPRGVRLLQWVSRHRVMVSADALLRVLRTDPELHDAALAELTSTVDALGRKVHGLRKQLKLMHNRLLKCESRPSGRDILDRS